MTGRAEAAPVWVLGARGMIGRALTEALAAPTGGAARSVWTADMPWQQEGAVGAALQRGALEYHTVLEGRAPTVVWAAGTAVIGSEPAAHVRELAALRALLEALSGAFIATGSTGHLLLVSSAGGVYAGSGGAPFDERTHPVPLSEYGRSKLLQEEVAIRSTDDLGWTTSIGRVANVYGLRQSVTKQQGIVSRLCRAAVFGEAVDIFVPESTTRHYVHARDVGRMLVRQLEAASDEPASVRLRIISAGPAVSLRRLVDTVTEAAGHDLPVEFRTSVRAEDHGIDLRFESIHADATLVDPVPLRTGVEELLEALERSGPAMEPGAQR